MADARDQSIDSENSLTADYSRQPHAVCLIYKSVALQVGEWQEKSSFESNLKEIVLFMVYFIGVEDVF